MRLEFFMPMRPPTATHQEKKWRVMKGKPVSYDPPEVLAARSKLTAHLAGHKPVHPLEGAVRLVAKWCFPRGRHGDGEYRITKPDTDTPSLGCMRSMRQCAWICPGPPAFP